METKMYRLIIVLFVFSINVSLAGYWEIEIPTRVEDEDKKYLKADFYSTDTTQKKPTLLIQTPYNRKLYRLQWGRKLKPENMTPFIDSANYHYIIVDWRGFYDNKEKSIAQYDRGLDGYDIVEWIAKQSWSDGQIGTQGGSALGMIQFLTARHRPPHLVCAAPWIKNYQTSYTNYYYGGVLRLQQVESLSSLGFNVSYKTITQFYLNSLFWKNQAEKTEYSSEFSVPMFIVTGWYDHYPGAIIDEFEKICNNSHENVKDKHKFMIGPWTHSDIGQLEQGGLEYPEAKAKPQLELKRFFDYHLLNAYNAWPYTPKVQYFDPGTSEWNESDSPLFNNTNTISLYLSNNNILKAKNPDNNDLMTFTYDPGDPSPTIGGAAFDPSDKNTVSGPANMKEILERDDNITFISDESIEDLTISGSCRIELYVSSDRMDTDFAVRLCDVNPDGNWYILTQGIRRMRFRESYEYEKLMTPGDIYSVDIEMEPLHYTFTDGHRLGIIITSSDYPMFDLNLNNGGELYEPGDTLIADNKVHFGGNHPSRIVIPTDMPVDVKTPPESNVISIYPNPANDHILINTTEIGKISIDIYSISGKKCIHYECNSVDDDPIKININSLENGSYIVKLKNNENVYFEKLLINR